MEHAVCVLYGGRSCPVDTIHGPSTSCLHFACAVMIHLSMLGPFWAERSLWSPGLSAIGLIDFAQGAACLKTHTKSDFTYNCRKFSSLKQADGNDKLVVSFPVSGQSTLARHCHFSFYCLSSFWPANSHLLHSSHANPFDAGLGWASEWNNTAKPIAAPRNRIGGCQRRLNAGSVDAAGWSWHD